MKRPKRFIIPIFIPHEGCRFRCVFCDQYAITGEPKSPITPAQIRETVFRYRQTSPGWNGERELAFFGGSFTTLSEQRQEELLAVGKDLITAGAVNALRVSTRPDAIDEKVLDRLTGYGVKTVEIGIQSMNDGVLRNSRRGHTASDSIRAATLLSRYDIEWIAQILPGLPGDTEETMRQTALQVAGLSPDGVRIYPALVLSGTEMERMYIDGAYEPLPIDHTLEILKNMIDTFERHAIPVLRIGLCPSIELERRVVAGPYHPALAALVYEARLLDTMINAVRNTCRTYNTIMIRVNPRDVSCAVGRGSSSITELERHYPGNRFEITADDSVERGRILTIGI
jgi:histone acetyltransferase (RNA polymerase elongator complex component)